MSAANEAQRAEASAKDTEPTAALPSNPTERVAAGATMGPIVGESPSRASDRAPSFGPGKHRTWSAEEIAVLARPYTEEKDEAPVVAGGDPALRRWVANLGRRSSRREEPAVRRPCSDGADFVAYSAVATPALGHTDRVPLPKVLVDRSVEIPTAIVPRLAGTRRRVGVRLGVALLGAWLGLFALVWLRPSARSVEGSSSGAVAPASPAAVARPTPLASSAIASAPVVTSNGIAGGVEPGSSVEGAFPPARSAASTHHAALAATPTRRAATPAASASSATRGVSLDEVTRY